MSESNNVLCFIYSIASTILIFILIFNIGILSYRVEEQKMKIESLRNTIREKNTTISDLWEECRFKVDEVL